MSPPEGRSIHCVNESLGWEYRVLPIRIYVEPPEYPHEAGMTIQEADTVMFLLAMPFPEFMERLPFLAGVQRMPLIVPAIIAQKQDIHVGDIYTAKACARYKLSGCGRKGIWLVSTAGIVR